MWKTCYYHAANDCLITVENCIFKTSLPFFKVLYQRLSHRANITAKQNHCRRQYHASGISLPKATRFPFREMRRTLLFWNRIIASGNAHFYACLRLFLHASTKVSCVGFIIWFPSGRCVVCFSFDQPIVASGSRLSYARILLFPASTQYPAGSPITSLLKSRYRKR